MVPASTAASSRLLDGHCLGHQLSGVDALGLGDAGEALAGVALRQDGAHVLAAQLGQRLGHVGGAAAVPEPGPAVMAALRTVAVEVRHVRLAVGLS